MAQYPKGLSPVQNAAGNPWNQQGTLYYVASDASNTYAIGDVVKFAGSADAEGILAVTKATNADTPLGVIVGIRVADPGVSLQGNSLSLEKAYLPLSAGAHYVYVVDDPDVIMEVTADSTALVAANLGYNASFTVTANNTAGLSQSSPFSDLVASGFATTSTLPLKVLGAAQKSDNTIGAGMRLRVRWNKHAFLGGIAGV